MDEKAKEKSQQPSEREIWDLYRTSVTITFLLLVLLMLVTWLKLLSEGLRYLLFSILFAFDFGTNAIIAWRYRVFWFSSQRKVKGFKARLISVFFWMLTVAFLIFAFFTFKRYYS